MRICFLICLLLFILSSCRTYVKIKSRFDNISKSDTTCIRELKNAKNDIRNGKLVYCHYVGNIVWHALRAEKEMDSLLKLHNIEYQNEASPCVIDEKKTYHCYCEYMLEEVGKKYGSKFIDSLLYMADNIYISKKLNDTFDYTSWDKPPQFPGDIRLDGTNHTGLQTIFEKSVVYPENYKYTTDSNSLAFIQIQLYIDNNSDAKVKSYNYVFWNSVTKEEDYNKEFYSYFKEVLTPLIENTKWKPARIKSFNVKSMNEIFVYLK